MLTPAELAARAQYTIRNLVNIATQIFKIIRDMTSSSRSRYFMFLFFNL